MTHDPRPPQQAPSLPTRSPVYGPPAELAQVVERNIQALLARRREEERTKSLQNRIADGITRFTGSMTFVYIHLVLFGLWIAINLGWLGLPRFDESFTILAMAASVEAIFLSTFVLITQNRMAAMADRRADLDLQVSLLAEHEVTKLVKLVSGIAERTGIETRADTDLEEIARDVAPDAVLDELETREPGAEER